MRKFANLFFIVYLIDGLLSLFHELFLSSPASGLRNLVAFAALLLALPLYLSLGIDRRLPKGVIIPQVLFIVWAALGAWPVAGNGGSFGLLAAAVQTLLGLLPFILYAGRAGSNRLLPAERFRADFFGLGNTLAFFLLHLVLLPLIVGFMAVSVVAGYADQATAGFVRLGSDGIHMQERVYSKDGKNIRLTGMVHIGKEDFYRELADSMASGRTVVLAEGVSDQDGLLTSKFGYGEMAQVLGLTSQGDVELEGRLIDGSDLERFDFDGTEPGQPDIILADADLNSFDPITIEFINMLGKHLFNSESLPQGMRDYDAWAKENVTPENLEIVMGDLLQLRNDKVISWLDRALPYYDNVVIPWGAMHMPEIEQAIIARGFVKISERERMSIDFSTLQIGRLLQVMAEAEKGVRDESRM